MRTLRIANEAVAAPILQEVTNDMIILIDEDTRIDATDGLNFTLQRRVVIPAVNAVTGKPNQRAGEVEWRTVGYHGSLVQAAISALQKKICTGDRTVDLRGLIDELRTTSSRIAKACAIAPETLKRSVLPEDSGALADMLERATAATPRRV